MSRLSSDKGCAMRGPAPGEKLGRLKCRADFLRVARGARVHTKAFTLQISGPRPSADAPSVGFTLTRKVGGAVIRNRARRRLKEAVRLAEDLPVEAARDYVLVGRIEALRLPFGQLKRDLSRAFRDARGGAGKANSRSARPRPQRTRPTA